MTSSAHPMHGSQADLVPGGRPMIYHWLKRFVVNRRRLSRLAEKAVIASAMSTCSRRFAAAKDQG
jgi:hypothetical protein